MVRVSPQPRRFTCQIVVRLSSPNPLSDDKARETITQSLKIPNKLTPFVVVEDVRGIEPIQ
jgi:hypothetical protein